MAEPSHAYLWNTGTDGTAVGSPTGTTYSMYYRIDKINVTTITIFAWPMQTNIKRGEIYVKQKYGGNWSEWIKQPTREEIEALNSNGLYDRGGVINNADLNTFKTPGLYYCSSTGGSNFPTGLSYSAALVEVSLFANSGGVCQVCIDAVGSSKRIWRRYFVNNAWSDWVKQPERQEITDLNSNQVKTKFRQYTGITISAGSYMKVDVYEDMQVASSRFIGWVETGRNFGGIICLQFASEGVYLYCTASVSNGNVGIRYSYI